MKSAEEIAEDLCDGVEDRNWLEPKIAKALTEYAEARVSTLWPDMREWQEKISLEVRNAALEKAAQLAFDFPLTYMAYTDREERLADLKKRISVKIRALKSDTEPEEEK